MNLWFYPLRNVRHVYYNSDYNLINLIHPFSQDDCTDKLQIWLLCYTFHIPITLVWLILYHSMLNFMLHPRTDKSSWRLEIAGISISQPPCTNISYKYYATSPPHFLLAWKNIFLSHSKHSPLIQEDTLIFDISDPSLQSLYHWG